PKGSLIVQAADCDEVDTRFTVPTPALQKNEKATFVGYTRTVSGGRFRITLEVGNQKFSTEHQSDALPLADSLYLTLGDYSQDLADATTPPPPAGGGNDPRWPHHAVCLPFEKTPAGHLTPREPLPDHWLGYGGIDLVVLLTEKADLLTRLNENEKELRALT